MEGESVGGVRGRGRDSGSDRRRVAGALSRLGVSLGGVEGGCGSGGGCDCGLEEGRRNRGGGVGVVCGAVGRGTGEGRNSSEVVAVVGLGGVVLCRGRLVEREVFDEQRGMRTTGLRRVQTMGQILAEVAGRQESLHRLKHGGGQEVARFGSSRRRHVVWAWDRGFLSV